MITPMMSNVSLTFADISDAEGIYNEASMNGRSVIIGKAARRVAAMARVTERCLARFPEVVRPVAF